MDEVSEADIAKSFNIKDNEMAVFEAGHGAGKSGSFFFFTKDRRFIIKTIDQQESNKLKSMSKSMLSHFKTNKNSIIARIYGLYSLKTNVYGPLNFIIMQNTAKVTDINNEVMTFDVKGSTVGRQVKLPVKEQGFWRNQHN